MMKSRRTPTKNLLLIVLLMTTLLFAACSSSDQENGETSDPTEQTGKTEQTLTDSDSDDSTDPAQLFEQGMELDEFYYEATYSGYGTEGTTRYWFKDGKLRMEGDYSGMTSLVIYDGEAMYSIDPSTNTAVKMSMDEEFDTPTVRDSVDDVDSDYLQQVDEEDVNGVPCYVVKTEEDGGNYTMWLDKEYGFPMKVEITSDDGDYIMEVREFTVGNVDDSNFELDDGFEIIDMDSMMENMEDFEDMEGFDLEDYE